MIRKQFSLVFLLLATFVFAQESREIDYIRLFAKLAVEEMELYKIPASITLSQGIIETGGGQSRLADIAKNHFGIKCKKEWTGKTISHTDDAPNECFRVYDSPQESYRDHSKFLAERPYYKDLFKLNLYDYKGWAHGLKKAGYATNPKYPGMLITKIEKYNLNQFDKLTPTQVDAKIVELYGPTDIVALSNYTDIRKDHSDEIENTIAAIVNQPEDVKEPKTIAVIDRPETPSQRIKKHDTGLEFVIAKENETFQSLGKLYKISAKKLATFNELPVNAKIKVGQPVFLAKKKNRGASEYYKVQPDDDMYLIAQKSGIRISKLYSLNRMKVGEQPKAGVTLNLKKRIKRKPEIRR